MDLLLLSKNTPIAKIVDNALEPIIPERLPLFLSRTGDVFAWLASRVIDSSRVNSRLLKKALRLKSRDDISTVLSVNAATITDNYWVKPLEDSETAYKDIRFTFNNFDKLALTGDVNSFNQLPSLTPELTNIGSFEKCWSLFNDTWWLIKSGKPQELYSEFAVYIVGKKLDFVMAEYMPYGIYIKSKDFTNNAFYDFEPIAGLIGEKTDYIKIFEALKSYGERIALSYIQMCYLDALVLNMDRHEYNYGILRDSDTGSVISFAPLFDHNIALVSQGYPRNSSLEHDILINDFVELLNHSGVQLHIHELTLKEMDELFSTIPWKLPISEDIPDPNQFTVQYILKRQMRIKELCENQIVFTK